MQFKPTFFTSDFHVGHLKSLEFDNRPFANLEQMHEALITRFNATVPTNGITYFLGDMGGKVAEVKAVIDRLNGTKVLVLGNHDGGMNRGYNSGFDVVLYGAHFYVGEHRVSMSHCPLPGVYREDTSEMKGGGKGENWHGESRPKHQMSTVANTEQFHLHGHLHSRKDKPTSLKILGKQFDIGVVGNGYKPVSLSQIESWIANYLLSKK